VPDSVFNVVVLYDGVCAFCNRGVVFLLEHDHRDQLRFASLQSHFAATLLERHGVAAGKLDTIYVVMRYDAGDESLLDRSDAVIELTRALGGIWNIASLLRFVPRRARDRIYDLIARHRHQLLGKGEICQIADARHRHKFLDHGLRDRSALLI
jgi:predicted DCC family thiol-disulfide oxidoreductase YuxK